MHVHRGFSLIELLVTMAIAVIFMTLAVPSFMTFIMNARLSAQSSDLTTALMYARSEAIARNTSVLVGSKNNSAAWDGGYVVYLDANSNGKYDSATDTMLRDYSALSGSNTLRAPSSAALVFTSNGYSTASAVNLRLCDARGTNSSRRVVLTAQGRSLYCSCDASSKSPPACSLNAVYDVVSADAACGTACP